MKQIKNAALVVAGGVGSRMKISIPKQYYKLNHLTILEHTISKFTNVVDHIFIAVSQSDQFIDNIKFNEQVTIIRTAGSTRQHTVAKSLTKLNSIYDIKNILIHDAARPFINKKIIIELLDCLTKHTAIAPFLPIEQSLKKFHHNKLTNESKENYLIAQTPQAFDFQLIHSLHQKYYEHVFDDDIALFAHDQLAIKIIDGCKNNVKITTQKDLEQMATEYLIGNGYDLHQLIAGDHVMLGGVKIPHTKQTKAHSDGDVILHSLTDAIFGVLADGDIGQHFPPTNLEWKDKESTYFLVYALEKLTAQQMSIVNIDITVISEEPKISPFREQIRNNLSKLTQIPLNRISIKATTMEKLGPIGEGKAISALCNIMIKQQVI